MLQTLEFHLDHFDGPMDLLMHLLEKNKIDVYDIPINELTDQYLMYLEDAKSMNLEIASHFLLFAAQLVRIKVKMLLPRRRSQEDEEDPRQSLVDQIVAYRFFKELSGDLDGEVAFYNADTDENTQLAIANGITNIPALLFLKDGKVAGKNVGFMPKPELEAWVKGCMEQ